MTKTSIEWTDFTINPFRFRNIKTGKVGHFCDKISPGCANCYASQMQAGPYLSGLIYIASNKPKGEFFLERKAFAQVLARKKPAKIFWNDMTDMFLEDYPDSWILWCWEVMRATPQHLHQVLTKRSTRMANFFQSPCAHALKNVMLGVSVENQEWADKRRKDLYRLAMGGWRTFVSYEPALGPVDWTCWEFLEQGIVGGESGPGARQFDLEWARNAIYQWRDAGTAPFIKQLGRFPVEESTSRMPWLISLKNKKGGDMEEWPADLRVREGPFAKPAGIIRSK